MTRAPFTYYREAQTNEVWASRPGKGLIYGQTKLFLVRTIIAAEGVGILSGFGTPDNPPDYNIKGKKALPREDTHPGTGLKHLNRLCRLTEGKILIIKKK